MTQRTISSLLFFVLWGFLSCSGSKKMVQSSSPNWIVGEWQLIDSPEQYESWKKINPIEYQGSGYKLFNGTKVFLEHLRIYKEGENWMLTAQVLDQNDGKVVPFLNTKMTNQELIFNNPKHDFPQTIQYVLINQEEIETTIKGVINGKEKSISYGYKMVKE